MKGKHLKNIYMYMFSVLYIDIKLYSKVGVVDTTGEEGSFYICCVHVTCIHFFLHIGKYRFLHFWHTWHNYSYIYHIALFDVIPSIGFDSSLRSAYVKRNDVILWVLIIGENRGMKISFVTRTNTVDNLILDPNFISFD